MRPVLQAAALCAFALPSCALALPVVQIGDIANLRVAAISNLSVGGAGIVASYRPGEGQPALARFEDGQPFPLARSAIGAVSPNGRWLLFLDDRSWVLRDLHHKTERRFELEAQPRGAPSTPIWSSDSRWVAVNYDFAPLSPSAFTPITMIKGARVQILSNAPEDVHDRASVHFNPRLLLWDVVSARPIVRASNASEMYAGDWRVDQKGRHVYYFAEGQHPYGDQTPYTVVANRVAETSEEHEVFRTSAYNQAIHPKVSPDGRRLAFCADMDAKAFGVASNLIVLDLVSDRPTVLTHDQSLSSAFWGDYGALYAIRRDGAFQQLERVSLDGQVEALTHGDVQRSLETAAPDHRSIVYAAQDAYGRSELRSWSVATRQERTLALIADPGAQFLLGKAEAVTWLADDGLVLKGLVVRPPGYDPHRSYPLFVDVHGGGPGSRLYLWSLLGYRAQTPLEWHLWADLGYVIFIPDYRSSGEYGAAVNLRRTADGERNGDIGGIVRDAEDIGAGVRMMIEHGGIDPHRIAILGQSAGGGRVNYLLTRSRLFAAGIIHDPIDSGAMAEDLEQARLGIPITWYGAPPISDTTREAQLTGFLLDGWRSRTPTLIMVGSPDRGALDPLSAETLYAMLQSVGVPSRFVRFIDDGHNADTAEGVEARYVEIKAWLDRYAPASSEQLQKCAPTPCQRQ